ncbi:putative reverse transcriptase domain-containing protein [Tanacetum coccineum]
MDPTRRTNSDANPDIATIIAQQLQNIIPQIVTKVTNNVNNANANGGIGNGGNENGGNNGCSYKAFLACKPRDFDGKGGTIALTRWIEKMESVIENRGCTDNQRVKYAASSFINKALTWWNIQVQTRGREAANRMTWEEFKALLVEEFCPSNEMENLESKFWNHTMVGANHAAYTDRFHELAKLVPHLVTPDSNRTGRYIHGLVTQIRGMLRGTQPTTIQSAILTAGIPTDEAVRCGILSKGSEKRKEVEETSKQGGWGNDNKRAKLSKGFVVAVSLGMSILALIQNQVTPVNAVRMEFKPGTCYECGSHDHFRNTCPKLNRAPSQVGNRLTIEGNRDTRNNGNQARGRAFNVNAVGALQDPKVVTEVADGKKVEVDRIIRGCKLELGNSLFTIDLIPLGYGSFDVIVGMDWLSEHKAEIVCHEKVVRIPLESGEVLRVQGERALEISTSLKSTKLDDIPVVRDFPEVFPEDLLGLPPQRQVEFHVDLVPGATPVANSPYRLAPSEMQELSEQLQELQD